MSSHQRTDMRLLRRLATMTMREVVELQAKISSDPDNQTSGFWRYTPKTMAKLDACRWAITHKLAEQKRGQP